MDFLTDSFQHPSTHWMILGVILLIVEFMVPGFLPLFFGVGALLTGLVCLWVPLGINAQILLFLISSVAMLITLRKILKPLLGGGIPGKGPGVDSFNGQTAKVAVAIDPSRPGKVEFNGAFIVERLGKYNKPLEAGLHVLLPFIDRVSYKHTLKEQAVDVAPQTCITKDNISVEVDGMLYMQVMDPARASYGINHYHFAASQLAQTTMRSVIGKLDLDRTFEERESINGYIVEAVDKASEPWGVKVTRYEVKNIVPPQSIKDAMEKQMRAEREKRAVDPRVAEQYITEFGNLARTNNTMIVPSNLSDIAGLVASLKGVVRQTTT